jgi:4-hydroxy-tetrahydrodipicolinate synthase
VCSTAAYQSEHHFLLPVQELMGWMFCEPNPIAVNTALAMCGLVKPVFRLPYVPLSAEQRRRGVELLQPLLAHIPGAESVSEMADGDFTVLANF